MEDLALTLRRLEGRRVLLSGHTGFKGSWLALWLGHLGARVHGLALEPDTQPSAFETLGGASLCDHRVLDLRDAAAVEDRVREVRPELVFHLAAQPLVRRSIREPLLTFETNVLGTAHLLEGIRKAGERCAVVVASSDKCYQNDGSGRALPESSPLGGDDPYSASKAGCELVAGSFRSTFFPPAALADHGVALATVRAGNVIGGGDWAEDRIVPDAVRAFAAGRPLRVRNPDATRPFQHVVEPLGGYLLLAAKLLSPEAPGFCTAWNFGPDRAEPVRELADALARAWGPTARWADAPEPAAPKEASALHLDSGAARRRLGWAPRFSLDEAARRTAAWYAAQARGASAADLRALSLETIARWMEP